MVARALLLTASLGLAVPLAAQQAPAASDAELKFQVRNFEAILRSAVERGAQRLAKRITEIAPSVELIPSGDPVVRGVPLQDYGILFDVQIPDILDTGRDLIQRYLRRPVPPPPPPAPSAGGAGAVNTAGRVGAAGVVEKADEMRVDPAAFDLDREYGTFERESLIDAMLDNSGGLPLKESDWLVIVASVFEGIPLNPLQPDSQRKLILSLKGEDLLAFRKGTIDRETVKQRIRDRRF